MSPFIGMAGFDTSSKEGMAYIRSSPHGCRGIGTIVGINIQLIGYLITFRQGNQALTQFVMLGTRSILDTDGDRVFIRLLVIAHGPHIDCQILDNLFGNTGIGPVADFFIV